MTLQGLKIVCYAPLAAGPAQAARAALTQDDRLRQAKASLIEEGDKAERKPNWLLPGRLADVVRDRALRPMWFVTVLGPVPPAHKTQEWMDLATQVLALPVDLRDHGPDRRARTGARQVRAAPYRVAPRTHHGPTPLVARPAGRPAGHARARGRRCAPWRPESVNAPLRPLAFAPEQAGITADNSPFCCCGDSRSHHVRAVSALTRAVTHWPLPAACPGLVGVHPWELMRPPEVRTMDTPLASSPASRPLASNVPMTPSCPMIWAR